MSPKGDDPSYLIQVKYLFIILLIFGTVFDATSQINLLRYNDNFDYLKKDSVSKKGLNHLKHIPLTGKSDISFGGEVREQLQRYQHINFGDVSPEFTASSTWQLLQRVLIHSNIEWNEHTRFFVQVGSTHRFLNHNPLTPEIDQNELNLQQAFVDYRYKKNWIARLGRQELSYGSHRLITFREGPNTRLTFDGAVVKYLSEKRKIDIFALSPVIAKASIFDDKVFQDLIAGVYITEKNTPTPFSLDYYFLNYVSNRRRYNFIDGKESRQVIGVRLFSNKPLLNYELEATYQFGKFNHLQVSAYSLSGDISYQLNADKKAVVGIAGNYVSGDRDSKDRKLNTYNLLFSKPQYGLTAPIGATNIATINPYMKIQPTTKLNIYTGINFLWRQSNQDGTYSPGGIQTRPGQNLLYASKEKHLGTLLMFESNYSANRNLSFAFDASVFFAGKYPKETGMGKTISYLSFKTVFKF